MRLMRLVRFRATSYLPRSRQLLRNGPSPSAFAAIFGRLHGKEKGRLTPADLAEWRSECSRDVR